MNNIEYPAPENNNNNKIVIECKKHIKEYDTDNIPTRVGLATKQSYQRLKSKSK